MIKESGLRTAVVQATLTPLNSLLSGVFILMGIYNNMNLKDNIRKILRENSEDKFQNLVSEIIDEVGIYEAKKYFGVTMTQLVKLSKIEINSIIANELLIENLDKGKLKKTYKEFNIQTNLDGIFYWDGELKTGEFLPNYTEVITAMATPFWDGVDYTPVEIDWFTLEDRSRKIDKQAVVETEGGGNYYKELQDKTRFNSVEELLNWYDEVYLPGVYDIIMNELLPKVQQDIQDKMDGDMIF